MLRPASEALTTAYFDALTFVQAATPTEAAAEGVLPKPKAVAAGSRAAIVQSAERGPQALGAAATPAALANAKPPATTDAAGSLGDGESRHDWVLILAITVPVATLALVGGYELWRRRKLRDSQEYGLRSALRAHGPGGSRFGTTALATT